MLLVGLLAIAIGWLTWSLFHPPEAIYQGKRLSVWISDRFSTTGGNAIDEAILRKMGTNSLPSLLKLVRTRESSIQGLLKGHHSQHLLGFDLDATRAAHNAAVCGFQAFGSAGKSALPALTKLLEDDDIQVRSTAAACIGSIGLPSSEAVPSLIKGLLEKSGSIDKDLEVWTLRRNSAFALGKMGSTAQTAIPALTSATSLTNDSFLFVAPTAQAALMKIKGDSVLPLIEGLKDFARTDWLQNAWLIGEFGTNAEAAVPVLIIALNSTNRDSIRDGAAAAIGKIGSFPNCAYPH